MHKRSSASQLPRFPRDLWGLAYLEREQLIDASAAGEIRAAEPEWAAEEVVSRSLMEPVKVQQAFARAARTPVADLGSVEPAAAHLVPESIARQHWVLPLSAGDRTIRLATPNPLDLGAEQALAFATSRQVEFHYALPSALTRRLDEVYRPERHIERLVAGLGSAQVETIEEPSLAQAVADPAFEAPTARLVDATIADAVRERASDIHFEPTDQGLTIRYRVDGVLREVMKVPRSTAGAVIRRVKVMGKMDVSDPLRPHDGRAAARVDLKEWDLRISSVPVARLGEKVVIRLLDPSSPLLRLDAIGLLDDDVRAIESLLANREGIVLLTGPTGSGKTSTLYAALDRIRSAGLNVVTVEDPVEYRLPGVNQIQVNEKQGFRFADALRSVLRQDPDVVLLGEIRDAETAQVAWQAALSGHFVMSTLHSNDSVSTIARLADIGVEPYKIAAALKGTVAQRLVRRLCPKCTVPASADVLPPYARPPARYQNPVEVRESKGCAFCSFTGYRGRFAVQEILAVDGAIAELIAARAPLERVAEAARRFGMRTLWESGIRRVWSGETSYGEVVRVLGDVEARRVTPVAVSGPADEVPAGPPPGTEPVALPALPEAEQPQRFPASPLVLVADDDPAMRNLAAAVLISEGFSIIEAENGIAALEAAHRQRPSLVLLDMEMPNLDGFGVLGALRQSLAGRGIPVVVVTAHDDPDTESRCIELGAEDFIAKPIRPASLIARIRAVLRRVGSHA